MPLSQRHHRRNEQPEAPRTPSNAESAMGYTDVRHLDITMTNQAVQDLIEVTENPRHRYFFRPTTDIATWSMPGASRRSSCPR